MGLEQQNITNIYHVPLATRQRASQTHSPLYIAMRSRRGLVTLGIGYFGGTIVTTPLQDQGEPHLGTNSLFLIEYLKSC